MLDGLVEIGIVTGQWAMTILIILVFCGGGAFIISLPFGEYYMVVRVVAFVFLFLCLSVGMENQEEKGEEQC